MPDDGHPAGTRFIVRREVPHPGAQLSLFDTIEGFRHQVLATDTPSGQGSIHYLEATTAPTPASRTTFAAATTPASAGSRGHHPFTLKALAGTVTVASYVDADDEVVVSGPAGSYEAGFVGQDDGLRAVQESPMSLWRPGSERQRATRVAERYSRRSDQSEVINGDPRR